MATSGVGMSYQSRKNPDLRKTTNEFLFFVGLWVTLNKIRLKIGRFGEYREEKTNKHCQTDILDTNTLIMIIIVIFQESKTKTSLKDKFKEDNTAKKNRNSEDEEFDEVYEQWQKMTDEEKVIIF